MKNLSKIEKVTAQLLKWGNNENDVKEMVSKHFESASKNYSSVSTIANYIRTIY